MKRVRLFLFLFFYSFIVIQCNDDDGPKEATDPYVECCGADSVEFTAGNAKLYVPNAFTPNDDGINDVFFPFFNDKVSKIEFFSISTPNLGLMYFISSVNLQNPVEHAWDGKDADGKKYAGHFSFFMTVTDDAGFVQSVSGSACSIVCDTFATVFKTKTGCYFPVQGNGDGGLDASLPTLEDDCFGQ